MKRSQPAPGKKFWWGRDDKGPLTIQVESIRKGLLNLLISAENQWCSDAKSDRVPVTWTQAEWDAANLTDWLPRITEKDLGLNEALCQTCRGTRWENTRDSDVIPCIWCDFTGKCKKRIKQEPTHSQRSPLHPKIPKEQK